MARTRWIQLLSLLIAGGALVGLGPLQTVINSSRVELELSPVDDPFQAMPHDTALIVAALGSFRGIVVDYLWIRADRLKDEGKHYEALQLADMICKLQPRFPAVWGFQAWNMAWNISVTTHSPEERWLWVRNGMRLLRDQGIPLNRRALKLYQDLSWIFLNKMGGALDDMHMAYKKQWAFLMQRLLGQPPLTADQQELIDALQVIADAPDSLDRLRDEYPQTVELIEQLEALGVDLRVGYKLGDQNHPLEETFFDRYQRLASPEARARQTLSADGAQQLGDQDQQFRQLLSDPDRADRIEPLLAFLRAKVLRERYKLDPKYMITCMNNYGPLDWRNCHAHAIYWASLGDQMRRHRPGDWLTDPDVINTRRYIFIALNNIYRWGRLIFVPNRVKPHLSYLNAMPDQRFIEILHQSYLQLGKDEEQAGNEGAAFTYQIGHANFLADAIKSLYVDGKTEKAAEYYDYLRRTYKERNGSTKQMYMMTLYDFVMRDFRQRIGTRKAASTMIHDMLWNALGGLALGDVEAYKRRVSWCRRIYNYYMQDKAQDTTDRRQLPPFQQMLTGALASYLGYGPLHDIYKVRLWDLVALPLKRQIYDQVHPVLIQMAQRNNWNPDLAFPEPSGMQQYRRDHPPDQPDQPIENVPQLGL